MKNTIVAVLPLLALGCGGNSGTRVPNISAYQTLLTDASAAVRVHKDASATLSSATCPAECSRYASAIRPRLETLSSMSLDMDACMRDMGHASDAQMQSTCQSMNSELTAHLAVCCTATDVAAEVDRHAAAMSGMLQQQVAWAAEMQGMLGDSMMSGGTCHH